MFVHNWNSLSNFNWSAYSAQLAAMQISVGFHMVTDLIFIMYRNVFLCRATPDFNWWGTMVVLGANMWFLYCASFPGCVLFRICPIAFLSLKASRWIHVQCQGAFDNCFSSWLTLQWNPSNNMYTSDRRPTWTYSKHTQVTLLSLIA